MEDESVKMAGVGNIFKKAFDEGNNMKKATISAMKRQERSGSKQSQSREGSANPQVR